MFHPNPKFNAKAQRCKAARVSTGIHPHVFGTWLGVKFPCELTIHYCLSYSPLLTRLSTVKPALFASEIEVFRGELKEENTFRTGFLQAGHLVNSAADSGRRNVNLPPHALQSPSQSSYSYIGMR